MSVQDLIGLDIPHSFRNNESIQILFAVECSNSKYTKNPIQMYLKRCSMDGVFIFKDKKWSRK